MLLKDFHLLIGRGQEIDLFSISIYGITFDYIYGTSIWCIGYNFISFIWDAISIKLQYKIRVQRTILLSSAKQYTGSNRVPSNMQSNLWPCSGWQAFKLHLCFSSLFSVYILQVRGLLAIVCPTWTISLKYASWIKKLSLDATISATCVMLTSIYPLIVAAFTSPTYSWSYSTSFRVPTRVTCPARC